MSFVPSTYKKKLTPAQKASLSAFKKKIKAEVSASVSRSKKYRAKLDRYNESIGIFPPKA